MENDWTLVDIVRNGDTFHADSWWKTLVDGHTVWKNHTQYRSGHEERHLFVECRDERYGTMAQVRVAIKRIYK